MDSLTASIPSLLQIPAHDRITVKVEEDLKWLEITEQQLDAALHEEEGNLREEDRNIFLSMSGSVLFCR